MSRTPLEDMQALLERATSSDRAVTRPVSVRVPAHLLISVDAFAAHSGLNRTQVMVRLLQVGIDATHEHLSQATREAIAKATI